MTALHPLVSLLQIPGAPELIIVVLVLFVLLVPLVALVGGGIAIYLLFVRDDGTDGGDVAGDADVDEPRG